LDFPAADANARDDEHIDVIMNRITKLLRTGRENAAALNLAIIVAMIFCPSMAKADGGVVRMAETQGPFAVTVFTPQEISRDLPVDVTIMVQRRDTGEVMMDADVDLTFVLPAGAKIQSSNPSSVHATRARSTNKLLYGASVVFPSVGDWQMRASVRQDGENAGVTCFLAVGMPPHRLAGLWPYLALPPFVIAMFVMNQWLRRRPA
jgi:hypothetical protein